MKMEEKKKTEESYNGEDAAHKSKEAVKRIKRTCVNVAHLCHRKV